jgi:antitoxin ParD1/3/4
MLAQAAVTRLSAAAAFDKICQRRDGVSMATMNVSLPEPMKTWVEKQAQSGRYGNTSDYIRDLIRRDQERSAKIATMQKLIDEGLAGGVSTLTVGDVWAKAERRRAK